MRAFVVACLAIIVVAIGGYFFLDSMQTPTGIAYATDGARISPHWSWRAVIQQDGGGGSSTEAAANKPAGDLVEDCSVRTASQWIFVDFGKPEGESKLCSDSQ